jgi:hypothetical protein
VSAATPTGAELRAWRERLELSVEWAAKIISDAGLNRTAQDVANLEASCCIARDWFATAPVYAAALTAEEQRRSAAPLTEPVAPEGVTVRTVTDCKCTYVSINRGCHDNLIATVWHSDARAVSIEDEYATPEALRFVADLADYRAAQHAAGEQQRKLNAVRAAEEAFKEADATYSAALDARDTARKALNAAKREAGL